MKNSMKVIEKLRRINYKNHSLVEQCSQLLYVEYILDKLTHNKILKPIVFFRCNNSMCPICNHIKFYKLRKDIEKNFTNASEYNYIFITISPCKIRPKFIREMAGLLKTTFQRVKKKLPQKEEGYITFLEFGAVSQDYVHLHLHAVIAYSGSVKGRNFITDSRFRLLVNEEFSKLIESKQDVEYVYDNTDTNIQSIENDSEKVFKKIYYILKEKGIEEIILKLSHTSLADFISSCKGLKLFSRTGIFAKLKSCKIVDDNIDLSERYILSSEESIKYINDHPQEFFRFTRRKTRRS